MLNELHQIEYRYHDQTRIRVHQNYFSEMNKINGKLNLSDLSMGMSEDYLEAAEKGVPEAQFNTASMYEHGDGIKKDLVQSVRWYLQCNESKLCLQKEDGISDLIEQLSDEEFEKAKSMVIVDQIVINIRLSSVGNNKQ